MQHPVGRKPPDRRGDGPAHEIDPGARHARFLAGVVIARDDLFLEDPVEVHRVGPVLSSLVGARLTATDRPAIVARPAFVPPAIEDAYVDDAVGRRLHPARARSLHGAARVVQPDVHALYEEARDPHVVVLEDEHAATELGRARLGEDSLDHLLCGPVGGVRLAGEHDLDGALFVPQEACQPVDIREQQPSPLVRREPPREADGQCVRVQGPLELLQNGGRLAVTGELGA